MEISIILFKYIFVDYFYLETQIESGENDEAQMWILLKYWSYLAYILKLTVQRRLEENDK